MIRFSIFLTYYKIIGNQNVLIHSIDDNHRSIFWPAKVSLSDFIAIPNPINPKPAAPIPSVIVATFPSMDHPFFSYLYLFGFSYLYLFSNSSLKLFLA
jgi:hypothetical protein